MKVVILNGTSSSGKSSISRKLQELSVLPFLYASFDAFVNMFFYGTQNREFHEECHDISVANFHRTLAILASSRFHVVVDHVFARSHWHDECMAYLKNKEVVKVGVHCPIEILEEREKLREDRFPGQARSQIDVVHKGISYDLEFDTSNMSPAECAQKILEHIKEPKCQPVAGGDATRWRE